MHNRCIHLFIALFTLLYAKGQEVEEVILGSKKNLQLVEQLPELITAERSMVIVFSPLESRGGFLFKGNWKEIAQDFHAGFRQIGVDAVYTLHFADLNAGPEISGAFSKLLQSRKIQNLVFIRFDPVTSLYRLIVTTYNGKKDLVNEGEQAWATESISVNTVLLRLGRQVLRQQVHRRNFLIPEAPEYLDELSVFEGTKYETFPSRLKSQKLAVIRFDGIPPTHEGDLSNIEKEIDKLNNSLNSAISRYPFKYEIVDYQSDQELYDKGFQYVLMPMTNTGNNLRELMNYELNSQETDFISLGNQAGKSKIKKIPADALVTKYYIKQTIVKDLHVGNDWDSDVTWEKALNNFIFNLRSAFKLSN